MAGQRARREQLVQHGHQDERRGGRMPPRERGHRDDDRQHTCWGSGGNFEPRVRISHYDPSPETASETSGVKIRNNIIERLSIEPEVQVEEDYNLVKRYDELAPGYSLGSHDIRGRVPRFVRDDPLLRLRRRSLGADAGTAHGGNGARQGVPATVRPAGRQEQGRWAGPLLRHGSPRGRRSGRRVPDVAGLGCVPLARDRLRECRSPHELPAQMVRRAERQTPRA